MVSYIVLSKILNNYVATFYSHKSVRYRLGVSNIPTSQTQ